MFMKMLVRREKFATSWKTCLSSNHFTEESWDDIDGVGEGGAGYDPTDKME